MTSHANNQQAARDERVARRRNARAQATIRDSAPQSRPNTRTTRHRSHTLPSVSTAPNQRALTPDEASWADSSFVKNFGQINAPRTAKRTPYHPRAGDVTKSSALPPQSPLPSTSMPNQLGGTAPLIRTKQAFNNGHEAYVKGDQACHPRQEDGLPPPAKPSLLNTAFLPDLNPAAETMGKRKAPPPVSKIEDDYDYYLSDLEHFEQSQAPPRLTSKNVRVSRNATLQKTTPATRPPKKPVRSTRAHATQHDSYNQTHGTTVPYEDSSASDRSECASGVEVGQQRRTQYAPTPGAGVGVEQLGSLNGAPPHVARDHAAARQTSADEPTVVLEAPSGRLPKVDIGDGVLAEIESMSRRSKQRRQRKFARRASNQAKSGQNTCKTTSRIQKVNLGVAKPTVRDKDSKTARDKSSADQNMTISKSDKSKSPRPASQDPSVHEQIEKPGNATISGGPASALVVACKKKSTQPQTKTKTSRLGASKGSEPKPPSPLVAAPPKAATNSVQHRQKPTNGGTSERSQSCCISVASFDPSLKLLKDPTSKILFNCFDLLEQLHRARSS